MVELPPPVKVSPVIKFFRYSLLIAGIFYGLSKRKIYKAMADKERAREAELAPARAKKLQEEKEAAAERDLQEIIQIFKPKSKTSEVKFSDAKDRSTPIQGLTEVEQGKTEKTDDLKVTDLIQKEEDPETCMTPYDGQNMDQASVPQDNSDSAAGNEDTCDIFSKPINFADNKSPQDGGNTQNRNILNDDNEQAGYFIERHPEELMKPEENKEFKSP